MTTAALTPASRGWSPFRRYLRSLWLLTTRDLKVRYSTSFLGYFWSVLEPLVMAGIYWFVFTQIIRRDVGAEPYIVFLLGGLLPWMWFNGALSDCTRAFTREAKLIRSTTIPRTIWVARLVLSKGIEFVFSIPVLAGFAIATGAVLHWQAVLFLPAILMQFALTLGIGLIIAPLVVFFRDLERAVRLVLRFLFYASPIVYGLADLEHLGLDMFAAFNPLAGIISLYRGAFFPEQIDGVAIAVSGGMTAVLLVVGFLIFRRTISAVLKEI